MSGEKHVRRKNEVFGCIPHARGAYRERGFFTMGSDPIVKKIDGEEA